MKNISITRTEIENFKQREMSELEVWGAMLIIREAVNGSDDICKVSIEDVDNETYYTNKQLQINDGFVCNDSKGNLIKLHGVFCREENANMLFGYASYLDEDLEEEEDMFLVRID